MICSVNSLKANYHRNDEVYVSRQREGKTGWNDARTDDEITAHLVELLVSSAAAAYGARVLELGCGAGNQSVRLASLGYLVTGVDISPTAVAMAKQRAATARMEIDFFVADVSQVGNLPLGPFDLVVDSLCLHCIIGPDRLALFISIIECLRPGGEFLVMTMCGNPVSKALCRIFDPQSRCLVSGDIAERYLGLPESIAEELQAAGFELAEERLVLGDAVSGDQHLFLAIAKKPVTTERQKDPIQTCGLRESLGDPIR